MAVVAAGTAEMMSATTPEVLLEFADSIFPPPDAAFFRGEVGSKGVAFFAEMTASAFSSGTAGYVDDMLALVRPWGFDVGAMEVPTVLWHGEADESVPVSHGRWLAEHVPGAELRTRPGHGHISILDELPVMIEELARLAR
jgi:pimeloyl-ACP methyl ester carboxylesterase